MKFALITFLALFSFSSFALVDSKNCPKSFSVTYSNITRSPLTAEIESSWSVKSFWERFQNAEKLERFFVISTRSNTALCVYTSNNFAALLQTNNGVDEIAVPFDYNVFFRTKVISFSPNHIEISNDNASRDLLAPIFVLNSDSVSIEGEVKIGTAEKVEVNILR